MAPETIAILHSERGKPELRHIALSLDMNVRRFLAID
jgi:hypothetical protein